MAISECMLFSSINTNDKKKKNDLLNGAKLWCFAGNNRWSNNLIIYLVTMNAISCKLKPRNVLVASEVDTNETSNCSLYWYFQSEPRLAGLSYQTLHYLLGRTIEVNLLTC